MSDELPKGWASARLEEIVTKKKGKKPAILRVTPAEGYVPYLDIHAIEKNVVREYAEVKSSKIASKDDLFVVWDGARSGWIGGGITGAIGSTIMALTAQTVESAYVRHYIAGQFKNLNTNTRGTGIPHVDPEVFWNLEVPLAPLAEQQRIVAKLEKLLGQVSVCQQRVEKMPKLLKRFRQSILAAACSGRLTADWRKENPNVRPASEVLSQISKEREKVKLRKAKKISDGDEIEVPFDIPKTWALCFFDDLAAVKPNAIKAGPFGSSLTKGCYVPKGFKVYGQEQVINGDPNFGDYYINEEKFKELQSCEVSAGDILVSLVGTIGKVLVIPEKFQSGIINPRLAKFSLHPTIVREYIANYLLSTLAKNMMSQQSHGGTMEILNLGIMRKLPIPLAPLAEQQEIVRRVEGLFALADQLELRLKTAVSRVCGITPSLLARAFAGKLAPQNPTDEPAEKLLERIKKKGINNS